MNRPELYNKTVDILFQAYFNDTLVHANCSACAVGNIIAANLNYTVVKKRKLFSFDHFLTKTGEPIITKWDDVFCTSSKEQRFEMDNYIRFGDAQKQIDATGYSVWHLAKIEFAFETANLGFSDEDYMFNGLVSVLEALKEIHEVTDADLIQANHSKFKAHYNTLCKA